MGVFVFLAGGALGLKAGPLLDVALLLFTFGNIVGDAFASARVWPRIYRAARGLLYHNRCLFGPAHIRSYGRESQGIQENVTVKQSLHF